MSNNYFKIDGAAYFVSMADVNNKSAKLIPLSDLPIHAVSSEKPKEFKSVSFGDFHATFTITITGEAARAFHRMFFGTPFTQELQRRLRHFSVN